MTTEIRTIKANRKNKTVEMQVQVTWSDNTPGAAWIKKADGKPLYGTTGYYKNGNSEITTFRKDILLSMVEFID